jgi:superfamily II DNA helicase RecQ
VASRSDAQTPGTIAHLKDSPLFNRSTAPSAINYRSSGRVIGEDEVKRAI